MLYALLKEDYKIKQFFRFLLKRSIRIDPSYYVTILLTLALFSILSHITGFNGERIPFVPGQFIAHLFYAVPFTHYQPYNHVFWTLFVEFQFYLIIGTLYFISSNNWYRVVFIAAFSLTCFIPVPNSYYMVTSYAPIFGAGMAMVTYFKNQKIINLTLPGALLLLIAFKLGIVIAIVIFLTMMVVLFFTLEIRFLKLLGDVSYSLYLTHPLVLIVFSGLLKKANINQNQHQLISFVAELASALLFSYIFYKAIEKPTTDLSKKIVYK